MIKPTQGEMLTTLARRWPCPCKQYPESEYSRREADLCHVVFEAILKLIRGENKKEHIVAELIRADTIREEKEEEEKKRSEFI